MRPRARKSSPAIVAGACGYGRWPPNSLEGAAECLAAGADGIEIDVHLTADAHVVLHHDYYLDPAQTRLEGMWITEPGMPLKDRMLEDLRRYDLGSTRVGSPAFERHPHRAQMNGVRIGTLPELLDIFRAAPERAELYIEIKTSPQSPVDSSDPVALTQAVMRDLEAADYLESARIIAFDWSVLRHARKMQPRLATGHLTIPQIMQHEIVRNANGDSPWADGCDPRHFEGGVLQAIKAHGGACWSSYYTEVTAGLVKQAQGLGLSAAVWGIDGKGDARAAYDMGVESITVSDPAILAAVTA